MHEQEQEQEHEQEQEQEAIGRANGGQPPMNMAYTPPSHLGMLAVLLAAPGIFRTRTGCPFRRRRCPPVTVTPTRVSMPV